MKTKNIVLALLTLLFLLGGTGCKYDFSGYQGEVISLSATDCKALLSADKTIFHQVQSTVVN